MEKKRLFFEGRHIIISSVASEPWNLGHCATRLTITSFPFVFQEHDIFLKNNKILQVLTYVVQTKLFYSFKLFKKYVVFLMQQIATSLFWKKKCKQGNLSRRIDNETVRR